MIKKFAFVFSILLSLQYPVFAYASAGAVKTYPGDWLEVTSCLPKNHSKTIYLQGTRQGSNWRTFVKFQPKLVGPSTLCPKGQQEYGFDWKVNIKGEYALYFYDQKSKKRSYCWPDWIDSK